MPEIDRMEEVLNALYASPDLTATRNLTAINTTTSVKLGLNMG